MDLAIEGKAGYNPSLHGVPSRLELIIFELSSCEEIKMARFTKGR